MLNIFCAPARYVQGRDATRELAHEMLRVGLTGRTLIIAGARARAETEAMWRESFGNQGTAFDVLEFGGECSIAEIERGKTEARRTQAKSIIGAGGGKALDTARAVASELGLPVVCCPTIAASDSPTSALSVVYSQEGVFEKYLFYKRNPDLVLVDTSVIARAPVRYLIAGMGDALATWFEAETAHRAYKANQVGGGSTLAAMAIAELCYKTLLSDGVSAVAAARAGAVTPSLERIVEANTLLSGLGFESGGLAVAHSVHNGLSVAPETHGCLHGEKVAFGTLVQLVLEGREQHVLNEVMAFCRSVGLPVTLKELGIDNLSLEQARRIAEIATAEGETSHNEPFPLTWQMVKDAIFAADQLGTAFTAK